jgi:P pilus assembly chaperone PapD
MKNYIFRFKKKILSGFFMLGLVLLPTAASATITIAPTIVVIEGKRYGDVSLINTGNNYASYQVSWTFYKMEEGTGYYEKTDKSLTDFDLTQHLALTPKRVTLGPKGVQKVRMGLRLKGEPPPPGDYRAHLNIQEVPQEKSAQENIPGKKGSNVGVSITVGFTIPVIYRVGQSDATAEIGNITTRINKSSKIEAVVPITKSESKYGILGDLSIYYGDKVVGQIKNANIFSEVKARTFTVPLNVKELAGGSLRVVYSDYNIKKNKIYAEKSVPIGQ